MVKFHPSRGFFQYKSIESFPGSMHWPPMDFQPLSPLAVCHLVYACLLVPMTNACERPFGNVCMYELPQ
ncbi:predicted protein [Streptomyces iranensis]|uniref:Uncharacterized protein n=1 Tax=Streptomyces iranensis TaxID=576784 RepID=A0A061A730_9ACTN|nr:predicted protein [Streptomyces iranensis]